MYGLKIMKRIYDPRMTIIELSTDFQINNI